MQQDCQPFARGRIRSRTEKPQKIALVHDYLLCFGGAERVLGVLADMFPEAPIYTIAYDKKITDKYFPGRKIYSSFVQGIPFFRKRPKYLLPLLPVAVESFDFAAYDLVISSSSAFVKGIVTKPKTKHICYCHTPMRFVWDYYHEGRRSRKELTGIKGAIANFFLHYIRIWDRHCESRVDHFIANSEHTKRRIEKFYRRDAEVIYPPVRTLLWSKAFGRERDYFLIVSQLRQYKRIDVAIQAFNKLKLPLVIIGEGDYRKKLESMAGPNIKFLGWQSDENVAQYYAGCRAFVFPGEEDFGITAVEALSYGKPVLAYRDSGVAESVEEGVSGEFFDDLDPAVLADGARRLLNNSGEYNKRVIQESATKFSEERFRGEISDIIIKLSQK